MMRVILLVIALMTVQPFIVLAWEKDAEEFAKRMLDHVEAVVLDCEEAIVRELEEAQSPDVEMICSRYSRNAEWFKASWDQHWAAYHDALPPHEPETNWDSTRNTTERAYRIGGDGETLIAVVYIPDRETLAVLYLKDGPAREAQAGDKPRGFQRRPGGPYQADRSGVTNPELKKKRKPFYPQKAMTRGLNGNVILEVIVRKDGTISDPVVLRSSVPDMGFEEAAIKAVLKWRYEPATLNGKSVDVYFTLFVDFKFR